MSAVKLYTPQVLGLAMVLAQYPLREAFTFNGTARSVACGSAIELGLDLDDAGNVSGIGIRSAACAIGQASAAIFAQGAAGRDRATLGEAHDALANWLAGEGELPDWPGLDAIAAARDYPARHGALMLPWKAALQALPSA